MQHRADLAGSFLVTGKALPGPWIDLLTEGVDLRDGGRQAVVMAVRRIMLSAHRLGITYLDLHPLLTDVSGRRLAAQLATGHGGRKIAPGQREQLLQKLWADTAKITAQRPPWNRDDVLAAIEHAREALDTAEDLGAQERAVMAAVIDLADAHGSTRVAAPVHQVAEITGITERTCHRILMRLCASGEWLALAKRGDRRTRRSNLYALAPALLRTYGGASPPICQPPPICHPPTCHPEESAAMAHTASLTFHLDAAQAAEVAALVARLKQGEADQARPEQEAGVVDISTRRRSA